MEISLRKANINDLPKVNALFKKLIADMHLRNVTIWSEYYPFFMFKTDIEMERMYLVENEKDIVSVFVLADQNDGESSIKWSKSPAKAMYLDRFAVNVDYLRQGIGTIALSLAEKQTKKMGYDYLRLFVVLCNTPAIRLYEKNNYSKKDGLYVLKEDDKIRMVGYEKFLN